MMVLAQTSSGKPSARPRRLGVAEARSRFSKLLRGAAADPTITHSRGRDLAVVLGVDDYERLLAGSVRLPGGAAFLARVERLKQRRGGGMEDLAPAPVVLEPQDPFAKPGRAPR